MQNIERGRKFYREEEEERKGRTFLRKNWLEFVVRDQQLLLYKMVGVSRDSVLNVNSGQHAVNVPIILTSGSNLSLRDVDIMST